MVFMVYHNLLIFLFLTMLKPILLAGSSHPELGKLIAENMGIPLSPIYLSSFDNGEIDCRLEESVRGRKVYILQSSNYPVNRNFMELLIIIQTCRLASAAHITVISPLFPYSRHLTEPLLRRDDSSFNEHQKVLRDGHFRNPVTSEGYNVWSGRAGSLIARMLEDTGVNHIITIDLHSKAFQGYFKIPLDNLNPSSLFIPFLKERTDLKKAIIVSPDAGGCKRASNFSNFLGIDLAIIHSTNSQTDSPCLVGDVEGRDTIIIDDMSDTSNTLIRAATILHSKGARSIIACITHGIFSGDSISLLSSSELTHILLCNTVPQPLLTKELLEKKKFILLDTSILISEALKRGFKGESMSLLMQPNL